MTKSEQFLWALCGAVAAVDCGGQLYVGDTDAGAAGTDAAHAGTSGSGGASGTQINGGAGTSPSNGGHHPGAGGTGFAGHVATAGTPTGGSTSNPEGGAAGDEHGGAGQGGTGATSGTGGDAGAGPGPCDCGSTTALAAIDCRDAASYGAYVSYDGSVVGYISQYPYTYESGLWVRDQGVTYRAHRAIQGLSADGQTALFRTASASVIRPLGGKDKVIPINGTLLSLDGLNVLGWDDANQFATWTAAGGTVTQDWALDLVNGVYATTPTASAFGGQAKDGAGAVAFVWNATGLHEIGGTTASSNAHQAYGAVFVLSDDGKTAAGIVPNGGTNNGGPTEFDMFRWTEADGLLDLGPCRTADWHGACDSLQFISGDGSVLATTIASGTDTYVAKAYRWTSEGLVDIAPDDYAAVRGISADGQVIAGGVIDLDTTYASIPFVWDATHGKQDLAERLAHAGANLDGWTLGEVSAFSRDGTVVVGNGTCNGVPALYRAYLPR